MATEELKEKKLRIVGQRMVSAEVLEEMFGICTGTLANWRSQRRGPSYYKIGSRCLYDVAEVDAWIRSNRVRTVDSLGE